MKINYNTTKISALTFTLILTISFLIIALPNVTAQGTRDPIAYINAVPNPVEINTVVVFHVGSVYPTPSQIGGWTGLSVEITKPDGSTETITGINTDTTGGTGVVYTPTQVGTYTVRTHFPETITTANGYYGTAGTIMADSYSDPLQLVVTDEPVAYYPGQPLPTEYWTRPIDGQFREWNVIAGNSLDSNMPTGNAPPSIVSPYNEYAPESAHVLWRKPLNNLGGLAGGTMGEHGFEQGDAYEPLFSGAVIIGGILCYNEFKSNGGTNVDNDVIAVDLHTGEVLWKRPLIDSEGNRGRLSFGQVFYWDSYNHHAVYGFLWCTSGSTWNAFEVGSGRWIYGMYDVPSGTNIIGDNGEIYRYYVNKNQGYMTLWNSSRVVSSQGSFRFQGNTYNATRGIEWTMNITGLSELEGSVYKYRKNTIIGTDFQRGRLVESPVNMWCIGVDLINGPTLLWHRTWDFPGPGQISIEDISEAEDLFIVSTKETRVTYGFRLSNGEEIWGPTPSRFYTDNWGHSSGNSWDIIAEGYGKVIAGNYGGVVWCYSAINGSVLWTYINEDPYVETLHGNNWRFRPAIVTDGKLYIENTEHNPRDPQPRGAPFVCIDLETGERIWQIDYRAGEWSTYAIIGDSTIVVQNTYDQNIYAIGKGPSKTTIDIKNNVVDLGNSVLVEGTVMDVSPGTTNSKIALRFPDGVPAVADEYMTDWMYYVYNQFSRPTDAMGVEVRIQVVDPAGGYSWIGTTYSDSYGNYAYSFIPQMKGLYTIIVSFVGSNSFFGSQETAYVQVDPAPPTITIPSYPGYQGPSTSEIANSVVASLPAEATPTEVAQAVVNAMPEYPEPQEVTIPEYTTIDIVLVILVAIAIILCVILLLRKK